MDEVALARQEVTACERKFRRHGLPMLVDDHSDRRDVFGRAAPLLLVLLIGNLTGAANLEWPFWQNALAIVVGAIVVAAAYAGLNVLRGRPWTMLPQDVGLPELAFFVFAPAVPSLLGGWQWQDALLTIGTNLLFLALIWVVVRYGLHATVWWGLRGGIGEFGASLLRLLRFLPLLLIFSIALFYNTEVWQVFDHTPGISDYILGVLFGLLILFILRIRLRSETTLVLAEADKRSEDNADAALPPAPPYTRSQLTNVRAMIGLNQLIQVLIVSLTVGVFFFTLGTLTITEGVMESWSIRGGSWVEDIRLGSADLLVSQTLLRVSVALATFTGLYYAISVLTDSLYRDDFVDDMGAKMRDIEGFRRRYLVALDRVRTADAQPEPRD